MKNFISIVVFSIFFSGSTYAEAVKFFGITIGGSKATAFKNKLTLIQEGEKQKYGVHKSYILNLEDPKSNYFYYFNYDTIRLDPEFEKRMPKKAEYGYKLWAEGKPLYDTFKDCNIYRKGFLKKLNIQYNEKGYKSEIDKLFKEYLTFKVKSKNSKHDRVYTIWTTCVSNDGGGLNRITGTRPKETEEVKFFLIVSIRDVLVVELIKELYKRYEEGSLENPNTDGF